MLLKKKKKEEEQSGSKLAKEYYKTVYCCPAYLTYMQNTSCEMPDWMKHKLESRLLGELSTISDMKIIKRKTKKPLEESEKGE